MISTRDRRLIEGIVDGMAPAIREYVEAEIANAHQAKPRVRVPAASDDAPAMSYRELCELARRNRALLLQSSMVVKAMRDEAATKPRVRVAARTSQWT